MKMRFVFAFVLSLLATGIVFALKRQQEQINTTDNQTFKAFPDDFTKITDNSPIELGEVHWLRNYDDAIALAKKQQKPILILFQEVPGCATCTRYGHEVLSHPLIVETIENYFVPLAIHNNKQGHDAKILKKFNEPSWNNPVVRVISMNEKEIAPRLSRNYSPAGMVQTMITAMEREKIKVPEYLRLLQTELGAIQSETEEATFSMYCFWTGEKVYGQLNGVVATNPGFMNGHEVVTVTYLPNVISASELAKHGQKNSCASNLYSDNQQQNRQISGVLGTSAVKGEGAFRPDRTPKYYMSHTVLKYVPMTTIQATRVNAAIGNRQSFEHYLSPKQLQMIEHIQKHPKKKWKNLIHSGDFNTNWNLVSEMMK